MTSFLTQRIWFEQTHAIFIYYFSNSFVAAAFYVCFSFPFYSLNSYRKSFFLYYELYAFPFFNLFFMYRGKFFETFFILLLAASSNLRRKEDSKCSLDQVHFHTFFITKFLSSYELALFLMVDFPHSRLDIIKMNLASLSASFAWRLFFVPRFFARTSKK